MPITKSAKKKLKQDKKKTQFNRPVKTKAQKAIVDFRKSPTSEKLKIAYQLIDKAAKKKVFHRNKASRLKSKQAKLLQKTKTQTTKKPPSSKVKKTFKKS